MISQLDNQREFYGYSRKIIEMITFFASFLSLVFSNFLSLARIHSLLRQCAQLSDLIVRLFLKLSADK